MKNRTDLLNFLAEKYNLQRYLEIGVQVPELNFDKVICKQKVGVDPDPLARATWQMTSDEFFHGRFYEGIVPDLVFIDGLHTKEQVKKDFENALKILSPNGFILIHDCNPEKEEHTIVPRPTERGHWNGDVWKFAAYLTYPHDDFIRPYVVNIDNGCLVFHNGEHDVLDIFGTSAIAWNFFDQNRKELLNLITWDEFISLNSHV
jgi:hypothetical protein